MNILNKNIKSTKNKIKGETKMKKQLLTIILAVMMTLTIASPIQAQEADTMEANASGAKVTYQTHVQNVGWQGWRSDGQMSGTEGMSYRLEGIKLTSNVPEIKLYYKTHVQNVGWQRNVNDGEFSGTEGQSLRLEAIKIGMEGNTSDYDLFYRVHAQNFGWMGWAKASEEAGTAGFGYRLEAIEVVMLPKGTTPADYNPDKKAYVHIKGVWEHGDGSDQVNVPY